MTKNIFNYGVFWKKIHLSTLASTHSANLAHSPFDVIVKFHNRPY